MELRTDARTMAAGSGPAILHRVASPLALGTVAGPVLFTAAWLVLGFISRGYTAWDTYVPYSAVHQGISGLGLGETAPFMNAAFVLNGVLIAAGLTGVFGSIAGMRIRARYACIALLLLPAIGSVVDGLFNFESFLPHMGGFALVLTTVVSFPVVGMMLRRVAGWGRLGSGLVAAGPVTLVFAIAYFASFTPTLAGTQTGVAGLVERALVVDVLAWYVAMGLLAFANRPVPARAAEELS